MGELLWHCAGCGQVEPAQSEYEPGDSEPCCLCEQGVARVVTLQEAAKNLGTLLERNAALEAERDELRSTERAR